MSKETYIHVKRAIYSRQKRPISTTKETYIRGGGAKVMEDSTCRVLTHFNAHIKETCIHVKRDLDSSQTWPVFTAKETNIHVKRDLYSREKRPIFTSKETCAHVKENLYSCQQAPAIIFTHTLSHTRPRAHTLLSFCTAISFVYYTKETLMIVTQCWPQSSRSTHTYTRHFHSVLPSHSLLHKAKSLTHFEIVLATQNSLHTHTHEPFLFLRYHPTLYYTNRKYSRILK